MIAQSVQARAKLCLVGEIGLSRGRDIQEKEGTVSWYQVPQYMYNRSMPVVCCGRRGLAPACVFPLMQLFQEFLYIYMVGSTVPLLALKR